MLRSRKHWFRLRRHSSHHENDFPQNRRFEKLTTTYAIGWITPKEIKKMINDYYTRYELEALQAQIRGNTWTHTLTFTLPVDSPSMGDMWDHAQKGTERLLQKDRNARFSIFVCVNRDRLSCKRPHLHGLVSTVLEPKQVASCFYRKETLVLPYRADGQGDWIAYVTGQAIRDTHLHNMEGSYATI